MISTTMVSMMVSMMVFMTHPTSLLARTDLPYVPRYDGTLTTTTTRSVGLLWQIRIFAVSVLYICKILYSFKIDYVGF